LKIENCGELLGTWVCDFCGEFWGKLGFL